MARRTASLPAARPRPDASKPKATRYVVAVLAGALVAGPVGYLVGRPDADQAAIAEMQEADAKRDVQQIGELTTLVRKNATDLNAVLSGLADAFPKDQPADAGPVAPARIGEWQKAMERVAESHSNSPSGMTATNVARGGFRSAVSALAVAVDTYAAAAESPAGSRKTLLGLAERQRSTAVAMWAVAATQLDQINIHAGNGHQHVYLTGEAGEGAITADEVPEGHPTH
ncbi:hypothetical protein [Sphaerisporangium sp. TRM90804]|uniref:hypothetical protein n=1 Tax=Sphaerisporangium sp. TRM90804 TaxID=3031113 RepID=UPI002449A59A|nr:hypothetical protein [Sphaerisporangium sp. TRM90804]MDH2425293.1 hypothetical protein [Sphaerisporangium sp. TRM90804]